MAYGEAVLALGAILNWSGITTNGFFGFEPAVFNVVWVGLSNITMALALSLQMKALRIPYWKTLIIWLFVLNGSGLAIFLFLKHFMELRVPC
jgi:hypothetical protein